MAKKIGFGIDVGTMGIKFAQVGMVQGRAQIWRTSFFPLPGNEEDNFSSHSAQCLRQFLKNKRMKVRNAVAGISGQHLNIRYLRVPPVPPARLAKIVDMDVEQFTATASADLSHGYLAMDLPASKSQQDRLVAVAVAKSGFLDRLHYFFRKAGISVSGFVPQSYALYCAFIKLGQIPEKQMLYLLDIGRTSLELVLSRESSLYFFRNVNTGSNIVPPSFFQEKAEDVDRVETIRAGKAGVPEQSEKDKTLADTELEEESERDQAAYKIPDAMEASLKYARMQTKIQDLKFDQILLSGGASKQKGMVELLQSRTGKPVSFFTWDKDLIFTDAEVESSFAENSHNFPIALGLAYLATQETTLKMVGTHQKVRELVLGRHLFEYASLAVALLLSLIAIVITYNSRFYCQNQRQQKENIHALLQRQSGDARQTAAETQKLERQLAVLSGCVAPNRHLLEAVHWLHTHIPPKMCLTELSFKKTGKEQLVIRGVVEEYELEVSQELAKFQALIKESLGWEVEGRPKPDQDPKKLNFTLLLTPK